MAIDLAIAAKRYDEASGSAVFTGCIPLKPGQLLEANLSTVALFDGATEIGCTAGALWPQHPDGSMKVVRIATTLTLNAGVQKNLTLRLGNARTVSGPTQPPINLAWMRNPRLIGSIDAAHMCASRVAPLPLVPIPHPNLPSAWNAFLTTEWDEVPASPTAPQWPGWGKFRAAVMADDHTVGGIWNNAAYNFVSAMYCKYLTSGSLDRLWEAHHAVQYGAGEKAWGGGLPISMWGASRGSSQSVAPYTNDGVLNGQIFLADGTRFDCNPDGWVEDDAKRLQGSVTDSEPYNTDFDMYMCYVCSGWDQARGVLLGNTLPQFYTRSGASAFPDNPPTVPMSNAIGSNLGTTMVLFNAYAGNYGGRFLWRGSLQGGDLFAYLLSAPVSLYRQFIYHRSATVPPARTAADRAKYVTWFRREHLDYYDKYSDRYVTGHWLKGSWWSTPGWAWDTPTYHHGLPFFHLKLLTISVMLYYMNVEADPRIAAFIIRSASLLRQCLSPLTALPGPPAGPAGRAGYALGYDMPNSYTNNATDGPYSGVGGYYWPVTTLLPLFALAYRLTGDDFYRDVCDRHASHYMMAIANGAPGGYGTSKEAGETYLDAFYAAAWRAGVPVGGWDLGDTLNVNIVGSAIFTFATSTPPLNASGVAAALASEATLQFETANPILGPISSGISNRVPVTRTPVASPRPVRRDLSLAKATTLRFETAAFLTVDKNMKSEATLQFATAGRLQGAAIAETFTTANTTTGIDADHDWTLLAGTAFKINNNMAVVENSPAFATQIARLDDVALGANDFDIILFIGVWLLSGSSAWFGVGGFNSAAATGYGAHLAWDGSAHRVSLWKWVAGAPTRLGAEVIVNAPTPGSTQLRVRRFESTGELTAFYNGAQIVQLTDTAITANLTQPALWGGMGGVPATCRLGADQVTADIAA